MGEIARADSIIGKRSEMRATTIDVVPFVDQSLFDQVLAGCDLAFVRGEDSFAQVQWHGRPFVWQIYPQTDSAHERKLEAFLSLYLEDLPPPCAKAIADLWRAWNSVPGAPTLDQAWPAFVSQYSAIEAHAIAWADRVAAHGDLVAKLETFIRERL